MKNFLIKFLAIIGVALIILIEVVVPIFVIYLIYKQLF